MPVPMYDIEAVAGGYLMSRRSTRPPICRPNCSRPKASTQTYTTACRWFLPMRAWNPVRSGSYRPWNHSSH